MPREALRFLNALEKHYDNSIKKFFYDIRAHAPNARLL